MKTIPFLQNATDPLFKELYKKLMKPNVHDLPSSYGEAVNRICEGKFAFVTSAVFMKKFSLNSDCDIIQVPHTGIPGLAGIATKKKFPFLGLMNHK